MEMSYEPGKGRQDLDRVSAHHKEKTIRCQANRMFCLIVQFLIRQGRLKNMSKMSKMPKVPKMPKIMVSLRSVGFTNLKIQNALIPLQAVAF